MPSDVLKHDHGLDLTVDGAHQQRWWRIQRMVWVFWAALIAAAVIGLLGSGPLANARVEGAGLQVEYERFIRVRDASYIRLRADEIVGSVLRVRMDRSYLEDITLESVIPPPRSVAVAGDEALFEFPATDGVAEVLIRVRPERAGVLRPRLRIGNGPAVALTQFSYP